jgi:hypothetical protein
MRRPDATNFEGREIGFHAVDPAAATTLSASTVERYNVDGFVSGLDVFEPGRARAIAAYIDRLLDSVTSEAHGRDSYSINGYHAACAGLWDLATDPTIVAMVTDLLGPDVVCWGTHLFAKLPGDGKEVPFHQDAVYWPFTPTRTTTVWLAIDDVCSDNSPVQFVPGSHLGGPIVHEVLAPDGSRVLQRRATGMEARPGRFSNELRAGQVSVHSDLMLHGSTANTSTRRRAGLTLRYAAAGVRLLDGYDEWRRSSIHVAGEEPDPFWADLPRPEGEHPELMWAGRSDRVDAPDAS